MKRINYVRVGFFSSLLIVALVVALRSLLQRPVFLADYECTGSVNTMFMSFPLKIKLSGENLFMNWDLSQFRELAQGEIPIPDVEKTYSLGVRHSDGFLVDRVSASKFSISHLHVMGTLSLDSCELEYPVEIDSFKYLSPLLLRFLPN